MRTKSSPRALAETIAGRIRTEFLEPERELPTVRQLRSRFAVSVNTVCRALSILREQGQVTIRRGRRPSLSPIEHDHTPGDSAGVLLSALSDEIRSSKLSAGSSMPKLDYYATRPGLSRFIVRKVYRNLIDQGLVYRSGHRFIVGRPDTVSPGSTAVRDSVVWVIAPHDHTWEGLLKSSREGPFCSSFMREADRFGVRLILHVVPEEGRDPGKLDAFLSKLRKDGWMRGERVRGALIVGGPDKLDTGEVVRRLLSLRIALVIFDRSNDRAPVPVSDRVTRCHFDEAAGLRVALDTLYALGHRRVGFIQTERTDWQENRRQLLERLCAMSTDLAFTAVVSTREDWLHPADSGLGTRLKEALLTHGQDIADDLRKVEASRFGPGKVQRRPGMPRGVPGERFFALNSWHLLNHGRALPDELRNTLARIRAILSLWPLLSTARTTAIICPSDDHALWYPLNWLERLRLRVPRDVSVISFDNKYPARFLPLTTVDWGFDYLGYQAFHSIMKIVPVNRDSHGNIPARCHVVDRGSVAGIAGEHYPGRR